MHWRSETHYLTSPNPKGMPMIATPQELKADAESVLAEIETIAGLISKLPEPASVKAFLIKVESFAADVSDFLEA